MRCFCQHPESDIRPAHDLATKTTSVASSHNLNDSASMIGRRHIWHFGWFPLAFFPVIGTYRDDASLMLSWFSRHGLVPIFFLKLRKLALEPILHLDCLIQNSFSLVPALFFLDFQQNFLSSETVKYSSMKKIHFPSSNHRRGSDGILASVSYRFCSINSMHILGTDYGKLRERFLSRHRAFQCCISVNITHFKEERTEQ